MFRKILILIPLITILTVGAACRQADQAGTDQPGNTPDQVSSTSDQVPPPPAIATNTPIPPTPTPTAPLAALVNSQPVFLADFERELDRYIAAQVDALEPGHETLVLDALIERELIRQAAEADGVIISPETVEAELAELRAAAEEHGGLEAWLDANQYTAEEFREALALELTIAAMAGRVTTDVPEAVEQVRARYIQMDDGELAQSVLDRARAGDDFGFLAQQNSVDRLTGEFGGDLGYFAPGSLLVPAVETAAFALQPGEISDLIAVTNEEGVTIYYIIQVTERDPNRALTANARSALLQTAFQNWVNGLLEQAVIERFVP